MSDIRPQSERVAGHGEGHEETDVTARPIVLFTVALVAVTVVVMFILAVMMRGYFVRRERSDLLRPAQFADARGQYPGPDLQDNPTADMEQMRADDRARLGEYGWADRKAAVARIPVERAMDILAARGLPTGEARPDAKKDTEKEPSEKKGEEKKQDAEKDAEQSEPR